MQETQNPFEAPKTEALATEAIGLGRSMGYRVVLGFMGFLGVAIFLFTGSAGIMLLTRESGNLSALVIVAPMAVLSLGCSIYMLHRAWSRD